VPFVTKVKKTYFECLLPLCSLTPPLAMHRPPSDSIDPDEAEDETAVPDDHHNDLESPRGNKTNTVDDKKALGQGIRTGGNKGERRRRATLRTIGSSRTMEMSINTMGDKAAFRVDILHRRRRPRPLQHLSTPSTRSSPPTPPLTNFKLCHRTPSGMSDGSVGASG